MRCVTAWQGLADVRVTYPVASSATSCGSGSSFGRAGTRSPAASTPKGSPSPVPGGRGPGAWQGRQPPRRGVTGPPAATQGSARASGVTQGKHQTPATRENAVSGDTRPRTEAGSRRRKVGGRGQEARVNRRVGGGEKQTQKLGEKRPETGREGQETKGRGRKARGKGQETRGKRQRPRAPHASNGILHHTIAAPVGTISLTPHPLNGSLDSPYQLETIKDYNLHAQLPPNFPYE
ncbi:uncharacterized protein [Penaeus vannamei]|uniref:uncharacterized protein n=1 Tax=Penaeus vannamei TaxID=6689 RepID=UPI00387F393B